VLHVCGSGRLSSFPVVCVLSKKHIVCRFPVRVCLCVCLSMCVCVCVCVMLVCVLVCLLLGVRVYAFVCAFAAHIIPPMNTADWHTALTMNTLTNH